MLLQALDLYQQRLEASEGLGDKNMTRIALYNMGLCCHMLGEHQQAIEHLERALVLAEELQQTDSTAQVKVTNSPPLVTDCNLCL